jgi:opacity protein-like surface antigen
MSASCEKTPDFQRRASLTVLVAASICGAVGAQADERRETETDARSRLYLYEVTPFVGYRLNGDFDLANSSQQANLNDHGSFALALDLRRDESSQYELLYSREETRLEQNSPLAPLDVNVEYLHVGGTLAVNDELPVLPYIVGTLGLTRLTLQSGTDDTRFSFSLGAGLKVPVTPRFGLRLEARGFLTLVDSDSAVFCASGSFGGVCSIRAKGSTFTQFELMAGAAFSF